MSIIPFSSGGLTTADSYLDGIADVLDQIQRNPALLRREADLFPSLYFYRFKKHVLVCDCCEAAITVLTIIHTTMDLPTRLAELETRLIAESEALQLRLRAHRLD